MSRTETEANKTPGTKFLGGYLDQDQLYKKRKRPAGWEADFSIDRFLPVACSKELSYFFQYPIRSFIDFRQFFSFRPSLRQFASLSRDSFASVERGPYRVLIKYWSELVRI